jgi:hypothetical protein
MIFLRLQIEAQEKSYSLDYMMCHKEKSGKMDDTSNDQNCFLGFQNNFNKKMPALMNESIACIGIFLGYVSFSSITICIYLFR